MPDSLDRSPLGLAQALIRCQSVTPEEGEFWDNGGVHKFKYLFESAKAYLTGTTPNLEEGKEHGMARL